MNNIINIADLFCGAGGTSTGAEQALKALGFTPRLTAINHWDIAVATHAANHPGARTLCTNLDDVSPRDLFPDGKLDVLWASPECTHHSVARGGRPCSDQSRSTAWAVVRWAEALRPEVVLVENVPEFETWGGLGDDLRPLKSKRGRTFAAWVAALRSLGYRVDWRVLCAADYGDPTTRHRLFVQAVRGKRKIVWPNPTHTAKGATDLFGSTRPWRTAREIIDWSLRGESIFARKRPLALKTLKRIEAGLRKYGVKTFLVPGKTGSETRSVDRPLQTVTCEARGERVIQPCLVRFQNNSDAESVDEPIGTCTTEEHYGLMQPYMIEMHGTSDEQLKTTNASCDKPLGTITAGGMHHGVVEPFIVSWDNQSGGKGYTGPDAPISTITTKARHGVVEPMLIPQQSDGVARPVSQPCPTVATAGAISLVQPFLVEYYGQGTARSVDAPMPTATTKERFALVHPVVEIDGERYLLDIRFRMLQPHELAAAQGFPRDYKFSGNKTEIVKQIGNAVPCGLARALVAAVWSQRNDITGTIAPAKANVA
ncbi:MAG: DNA cytosine methyltransferase [Clostridiaceae bacterium]